MKKAMMSIFGFVAISLCAAQNGFSDIKYIITINNQTNQPYKVFPGQKRNAPEPSEPFLIAPSERKQLSLTLSEYTENILDVNRAESQDDFLPFLEMINGFNHNTPEKTWITLYGLQPTIWERRPQLQQQATPKLDEGVQIELFLKGDKLRDSRFVCPVCQ